jgi:hypothetical protein
MKPRHAVWAGAALFALTSLALAHRSTFVVDGNLYFEMARQMWTRGSIAVFNGLDVIDSPELLLGGMVRRGLAQFPVPAPLYALCAAPAFALAGLRGIGMLDGLALGPLVIGFFLLARRILDERRAAVAALVLPLGTLLFAYSLFELPHVLATACLVWAVYLGERSLDEEDPRRAFAFGAGAGLLAGIGTGVRLQLAISSALIALAAATRARRRESAAGGFAAPYALCLLAMAAFNHVRFETFNPFTYGIGYGVNAGDYYLTNPGIIHLGVLALMLGVAVNRWPPALPHAALLRLGAAALAALLVVTAASTRSAIAGVVGSARLLLVDASLDLVTPRIYFGWMMRSLLESSPFLVLGLGGAVAYAGARPGLPQRISWLCLSMIAFLVVRMPENGDATWVLGGVGFSPRYLSELAPFLFLLACYVVRDVPIGPLALGAGIAGSAVAAGWLWHAGPTDEPPLKRVMLAYGALAVALAVGLAALAHRRRRTIGPVGALVGALVVLANGYGAAVTVAEESRAIYTIKEQHQRWLDLLDAVLPPKMVLVGWDGAMDGVFPLRAKRDVIVVNAAHDNAAALARTLQAFSGRGLPIYYFGLGFERAAPALAGLYRPVQLQVPVLVWRLDPVR